MQRLCTTILYGLMIMLITASASYAQVSAPPPPLQAPPTANPSAPNPAIVGNAVASPATSSAGETDAAGFEKDSSWKGSLLFTPADIGRLRKVMELYKPKNASGLNDTDDNESEEDALLASMTDHSAPQEVLYRYPYFYLSSIIYSSPDDWFIWLNGKRILSADLSKDKYVSVQTISKTSATFVWKPPSLPEVKASWDLRKKMEEKKKISMLGNVTFDELSGTVLFTLKPNQTFFSQTMQVVEGRIPPSETAAVSKMLPADAIVVTEEEKTDAEDKTKASVVPAVPIPAVSPPAQPPAPAAKP